VPQDDDRFEQTFGTRGPYIVHPHDIEHAAAREACDVSRVEEPKGDGRENTVTRVVPAEGIEPAELHAENQDQDGPENKGREANPKHGKAHEETLRWVLMLNRSNDADWGAYDNGNQQCVKPKFEGDRKALCDDLVDIPTGILIGGAEIATQSL
jgi:hypothetical protein